MNTLRTIFLVVVPSSLMGWILATLNAPWWVWSIFLIYVLDRVMMTWAMSIRAQREGSK